MRKLICIILLVFVAMTLFTGCQSAEKIDDQEEAAEAITDIGQDVENIGAALEEIDEDLS